MDQDLADLMCRCGVDEPEPTDEELVDADLLFLITHVLARHHGDAEAVRTWVVEQVSSEVQARALELLDDPLILCVDHSSAQEHKGTGG